MVEDVLANFVHDDYHADLVHVTVGGDTIQGTMLHPFWVIKRKDLDERTIRSHLEPPPEGSQIPGRWVDATDLKIGDQLLLRDGSQGVIENVRHEHVNTTVYNFAVADLRCYAVRQYQILVHNMCGKVGGSNAPSTGVGKYSIGPYNELKDQVLGLNAHHVGQQAAMKKLVPGYDPATAPTILVPKVGHTIRGPNGIVSRSLDGLDTARSVIARDINELRRVYPDIPNSRLQELIDMNKQLYPSMNK